MNNDLQTALYNIIKHNDFDNDKINYLYKDYGYYRTTSKIFEHHCPCVSLGRQQGHTTVINNYIQDNPQMFFWVFSSTNNYKPVYKSSNCHFISIKSNIELNTRGVQLPDYIIFDNVKFEYKYYIDIFDRLQMLYNNSINPKNTRYIGLGN